MVRIAGVVLWGAVPAHGPGQEPVASGRGEGPDPAGTEPGRTAAAVRRSGYRAGQGRRLPASVACRTYCRFPAPSAVSMRRWSVPVRRGFRRCWCFSCDMPFMHTAMLRRLVTAAAASPPEALMTAFMAPNGWTESLAAIYRVEAVPFPGSRRSSGTPQDAGGRAPGAAALRAVRCGRCPCFFSISTLRRICSGRRPTRRAARRKPGGKFAEIPDRA